MIQMKEITFTSFINDAVKRAIELGKPQLISWTKKIKPLSIVDAFNQAEAFNENRIFWSNSEQSFMLFGLGTAEEIIATENRFEQLESEWTQLVEQSIIYDNHHIEGAGLTAIGGMSFDPLRQQSKLWENFPTSKLTIPAYLIVNHFGEYYFTINRYVKESDQATLIEEEINRVEECLLNKQDIELVHPKIVYQIEKDPDGWKKSVQKAVDSIRNDEAQKIVLARELRLKLTDRAKVGILIERLMETQRQSYIFAYEQGEDCFIGATPERLVQVQGNQLLSTCLAGTAPRGEDDAADARIAKELLEDSKNREEHDYVVQMIKSSVEPFCHNLNIPERPIVLTLRNLQHLYTPVTATLNEDVTIFNLIEVLHPTPALGGVPTEEALRFIRDEEQFDRGWYGAPIGWLDYKGNSEFAVAIRSGLMQANEVSLFAGCGVMADSDPEMEYKETAVKFLPMLTILEDS